MLTKRITSKLPIIHPGSLGRGKAAWMGTLSVVAHSDKPEHIFLIINLELRGFGDPDALVKLEDGSYMLEIAVAASEISPAILSSTFLIQKQMGVFEETSDGSRP